MTLGFPDPEPQDDEDVALRFQFNQAGQTANKAFIAPIGGSYPLVVNGVDSRKLADFSVTVTRYIPTVELPGLGDVNGDSVVDIIDLAQMGKTLGTRYDAGP